MELYPRQCDNGKLIHARVKRLVIDVDGKTIGLTNEKVFNNSWRYEFEYADITTDNMSPNIIADNLLA